MSADKNNIELQERDREILRGLFESRVMTVQHIAAIYFSGRLDAARKRIHRLRVCGYINERSRRVNEAAILFMTKKAFATLQESGELQNYPQFTWTTLEKRIRVSDLTLQHEIQVLDVRAALTKSLNALPSASIIDFKTWPALYQFPARQENEFSAAEVLVKPDGYLRIIEEQDGGTFEHSWFLEVDRSSETQDTLARKGMCYVNYYKTGGYAAGLGQPREVFREYPFCVLMVLQNSERRNNAAEKLLQLNPPIYRQVWLTTWKEIIDDPLGAIWVQPRKYLDVVKGTAFDPINRPPSKGYRRQTEREILIEKSVHKRTLLDDPIDQ